MTQLPERPDLAVKVDANRKAAEMRHGFDQTAAGFARIAELISARDDDR